MSWSIGDEQIVFKFDKKLYVVWIFYEDSLNFRVFWDWMSGLDVRDIEYFVEGIRLQIRFEEFVDFRVRVFVVVGWFGVVLKLKLFLFWIWWWWMGIEEISREDWVDGD